MPMPIRKEMRIYYPLDWQEISQWVRFDRAGSRCESCGRPHHSRIRQLDDGRWLDEKLGYWRDDQGREAETPDIVEYARLSEKRVFLAAAHLDHNPGNSAPENLKALCQRCHLNHDRREHQRRIRLRVLMRRALGDLFSGPYSADLAAS